MSTNTKHVPKVGDRLLGTPVAAKTRRHNLDRRVHQILAISDGSDDELLSTEQVAEWFGVSVQWLQIGRVQDYGPKYTQLSGKVVRYRRGDCRKFLKSRTFANTAEARRAGVWG